GENAIGKQHGERVTNGRLLGEKVVFRFVDSLYRSVQEREAEHEEGDGRDEMVSHLARVQYGGSGYGGGNGESRPQHNVLKYGHAQDETRETRVQDFEIGKDLGNYRNGGDGHSDRKNNDQRELVSLGACNSRSDQHGADHQAEDERDSRPNNGQSAYFFSLFAGEQLLGFSAGHEHEQQETHPVDEIQNGLMMFRHFRKGG